MSFKTIGLLGRGRDPKVAAMLAELGAWLRELGFAVAPAADAPALSVRDDRERIVREFGEAQPDLVIVVGGDGTILNAAHLLAAHDAPLLGVNVGRLGFLADIPLDRVREEVGEVLDGRYTEERRFLLTGTVHHGDSGEVYEHIALNDVVMQKSESGRMIEFETHVDGSFVCTHRADGVIVATPTGSTAYALSGGGPILHPALDALVLVPICPHTLSDRPIVIGGGSVVEIVLTRGYGEPAAQVSWDGQDWQPLTPGDRVVVQRAADGVHLLHPLNHDYYKTLRTKLHWGHDRTR
ncbi:MAG TPA: NAD(+) kinase [Gammaproteobacteria bacterium]|jgi:NAD+ kinase|nr:NAD(+) kinase [Gammaproteobacteria bacterium]